MDYSFTIRKAAIGDVEAVYGIIRQSFNLYKKDTGLTVKIDALDESIEVVKKDIMTKEVFVAFIDDVPVGTIRVEIMPDNTAYVSRFGVNPDYHNIGIGKSLINLVDKFVVSKEIKLVRLHTASKHKDLVRFYYGRGFYVESITNDRGYIRAMMVKEY